MRVFLSGNFLPVKTCYLESFNLLCLWYREDTMVVPRESAHFQFYTPGQVEVSSLTHRWLPCPFIKGSQHVKKKKKKKKNTCSISDNVQNEDIFPDMMTSTRGIYVQLQFQKNFFQIFSWTANFAILYWGFMFRLRFHENPPIDIQI